MGNPNRFHSGRLHLRFDDDWRNEMSLWQQTAVRLLCGPRMRRYGY
jgi:hypothetical protein